MKRLLSVVAMASMLVCLVAGCGSASSNKNSEAVAGKTIDAKSTMKPIAKDDLKIGVIHITDPAEGAGYTYTHDLGIQKMQKELGLKDSQIIRKNNVADTDPAKIETAMRDCIDEGCNVIFATSFGFMDICEKLAKEFPDVYFSHGTGYKSNGNNFNNYFGRIYQARYLSGLAAGLQTKTNKIGYVAAMDSTNSEVTGGIDAFAMGVNKVNPEAKVYVKVTGSWFNPEGETQAAQALIDSGCDVIAQHCDTSGPQTAAEKAGVYGVGYNSDMSKDAPKAVICSVMWDWGVYYTSAVKSIMEGTWDGSNYYAGMKEGLVTLTELASFANPKAKEEIEAAKKQILDGSFNVFDGEIETNDGKKIGEAGKTLSDADITGKINWYFKNVEVK
ncbi:MAG: BMP family ABC transporter substrate-binding protein [Lachnospiraceae bacterium]|nr:BMP family ABC transporter substrate-binding protein [Lachnospiraceae bacterium]